MSCRFRRVTRDLFPLESYFIAVSFEPLSIPAQQMYTSQLAKQLNGWNQKVKSDEIPYWMSQLIQFSS
jgi:hypothetical protein